MRAHELKQPIEPPNKVSIARGLCSLVGSLPPDINTERGCLEDAFTFLNEEPPNVSAALNELTRGYAHAFRGLHRETRPEVWLIAAAVELLR
ncbi:hypothetical protein CHU94_05760 [Rhodoferax sp. TH121]|nr:hypothetical protein CHU94_05760 [Rhodoferax sp. TH121]